MALLSLKNIYKTYSQGDIDVPALVDINLEIEEGEYVAIMGPSGSGKSTLMNIIGCLDKPTQGSYYLGDNDIGAQSDRKLSDIRNRDIGFVFQNFNLMPRQSALQNVELPLQYAHVSRKKRKPLCEDALKKVGLEDRMSFKATQLSGGQKQRVAIARAMVNNPKILLADEPTGALDSKSGIQVMKLFKQLHSEGATIIMITHAREIAEHANRIISIFDGAITSDVPNVPIEDNEIPDNEAMYYTAGAMQASNAGYNAYPGNAAGYSGVDGMYVGPDGSYDTAALRIERMIQDGDPDPGIEDAAAYNNAALRMHRMQASGDPEPLEDYEFEYYTDDDLDSSQ